MSDQIKPVATYASDKMPIDYKYLCELAVIAKSRGTVDAFIDIALQFSGEAVICVEHLQAQNARLLNSLVWMRGRLPEYGLNLISHSKYEKMNSDIKLLDAIIAEAGNNNV